MQEAVERWSPWKVLAGTFILSAFPLLIVEMFPGHFKFVMNPAPYLVFHNIAEFFSIMVSLSMFGVGWFTYDQSKDRHTLFLGTAFLAIGLMDFMHTLGMVAMPDFITTNLPNKSVQFWVAVRLFQGISFLASAYVYAERPSRWLTKKVLMTSALLVVLLVFTGITFFPTYMPTTFVVGVGLTPFKKISEYLVIGLLCVATVAYWRRMERTGDRLLIYYLTAFVICIFSELVFAFYTRMFDTYNVLGHIYKVAAFSLIYYGIFKASVKAPYIRVTEVSEKLRGEVAERKQTEEALRDAHDHLEVRVEERTAELAQINAQLQIEIEDRRKAEEALGFRTRELEHLNETLEQRVHERTVELEKANEALRFLSSRLLSAHEEERKRIAGEIHDVLGSCLGAIKFKVEGVVQQVGEKDPETLTESLKIIIPIIQESIEECRRLQMDLRPSMLDDLGLLPALSWFCRRFQTIYSGIRIEQENGIEEAEIPDALKIVIYRVTQEGMNNIAKHSKADRVRLSLRKSDGRIELMLQDNGRGFDLERAVSENTRKGLGLTSMKERVELSGGLFAIESTEGKGTTLRASWPI